MAAFTRGVVGIFPIEVPPALQIGHANGSRWQDHAHAPADHRASGIRGNRPEVIYFLQVGDGDGGGKGASCLVGRNRYLVVPCGGWGDCHSSIFISPADLYGGVLPASTLEDAGQHSSLARRLGDAHRSEPCGNNTLG